MEKIDLSFLDEINLGEQVIIKSVRFNKDEHYLLKHIVYQNKRFATYIKELIERDIVSCYDHSDTEVNRKELEVLVREIIASELNGNKASEPPKQVLSEDELALQDLGIEL